MCIGDMRVLDISSYGMLGDIHAYWIANGNTPYYQEMILWDST